MGQNEKEDERKTGTPSVLRINDMFDWLERKPLAFALGTLLHHKCHFYHCQFGGGTAFGSFFLK